MIIEHEPIRRRLISDDFDEFSHPATSVDPRDVHDNVDGERDFLLESFDAAGVFSSAAYVTPAEPVREARTATGGEFSSDGRIAVMRLK